MSEKKVVKRPPMDPLPEALVDLKERNEEIWKLAQDNLIVVNLFWEEGGTILKALGRVSPEYVELQLPDCVHPGAETCDDCQALTHLFDIKHTDGKLLCPNCR
jgi:hypothetical protein